MDTERLRRLASTDPIAADALRRLHERLGLRAPDEPPTLDHAFHPTSGEIAGRAYERVYESAQRLPPRLRDELMRPLSAAPTAMVLLTARTEATRAREEVQDEARLAFKRVRRPGPRARQRAALASAVELAVATALASTSAAASRSVRYFLCIERSLSQRGVVEQCAALVTGYAAATWSEDGKRWFDDEAYREAAHELELSRWMVRPLLTARSRAEALGELREGRGCIHNGVRIPAPPFPLSARQAEQWYRTGGDSEIPWRVAAPRADG